MRRNTKLLLVALGVLAAASVVACVVSYREHRRLDITIGESNKQDETKVIGNRPTERKRSAESKP
jgi:hypothetical protein